MRPSIILAPIFVAAVSAQQATPTNAVQSASALVSAGNSVISSIFREIGSNTQYATYSSVLSQYSASFWASVTSQIGQVAPAASTNAAASSALVSYLNIVGPQISSLTALANQAATVTPTGSAASSLISSARSGLSSASSAVAGNASSITSSLSSRLSASNATMTSTRSSSSSSSSSSRSSSLSSAAATSTTSTRNVGNIVQAGAMGAFGAAVLGFAALL